METPLAELTWQSITLKMPISVVPSDSSLGGLIDIRLVQSSDFEEKSNGQN